MKNFLKGLFVLFFFLAIFAPVFCFAINLEVSWPVSVTGESVTSNTELAGFLKYIFDIGIFIGFTAVTISFIWAGFLFVFATIKADLKAQAMDRVYGAITALIILILLYLIIVTINPYLAIFKIGKLGVIPPPPPPKQPEGIYFHISNNCSGSESPNTQSVSDFGNLRNRINSVNMVSGDNAYVSIIYDTINYYGKCFYVNPVGCSTIPPFANSASVYKYNFSPPGDGSVTFFRKSSMPNKNPASSGYLTIKQSAIGKMYIQKLDNLKFTGADINDVGGENSCTVPLPERDCKTYEQIETKKPACRCFSWSSVGLCAGGYDTQCPSLAGTNIDSFKIYPARAYVVLFVYFDPLDTSIGPWTFCQEFPTKDDINKTGPINIKWEPVLNRISTERQKMMVPNYVIIFPVKP